MKNKRIKTVLSFELWQMVKAYGTYEYGNEDAEIWSFDGKLFRLCFAELPLKEKEEVLYAYSEIDV